VQFLWNGVKNGLQLITSGDSYTWGLVWTTLHVALFSTAIALLIGLPIALTLGLRGGGGGGRRTVGWVLAFGNAGLGLPPVVVGVVLTLLLFPEGPLGPLRLLFTLKAVILAQTILALPVVVALASAALRSLPRGLFDQARALGAHTGQLWLLALREARIGVMAAVIAALGSALSEVGAVILVGGNIQGDTQTLASAALQAVSAGHFGQAMAIGMILMGMILLLAGALTVAQLGGFRVRRRSRPRAPA
jgi:tungstate transport system permease protein